MEKAFIARMGISIAVGVLFGALAGYFGKCTTGACPLTATPWRGALYGAVLGTIFGLSFR